MDPLSASIANAQTEDDLPALSFANTADWHASDRPLEELNRYPNLVQWALDKAILTPSEAQLLRQQAEREPDRAAAVLRRAIALREAIYHIFSATSAGATPTGDDLALLNEALHEALKHLQIGPGGDRFHWIWSDAGVSLERMLWPAAYSAAALLASDQLERVKECADDRGCGYLFFDASKNRSRRWCSMESCGNRAKVRRYRRRQNDE
jgi:predicted RNA-binding Zn ribbon-like protein